MNDLLALVKKEDRRFKEAEMERLYARLRSEEPSESYIQDLELVARQDRYFNKIELPKLYTSLQEHSVSFTQGLGRLQAECFAFRFFQWFSKPVWELGEVVRDDLCSMAIGPVLDVWVRGAVEEERRYEAKERILMYLKNPEAILDLSNCQLHTLPDIFGYSILTRNLQNLILNSNNLTTLPESIGNLSSLTKLSLCRNQLRALPESLQNLTSLRVLGISSNHLVELPESLHNLTALADLDATDNQLRELPESLYTMMTLTRICVGSNQLRELSEGFYRLTRLRNLIVHGNQLSGISESIGNLVALESLNVSNNQLTSLPNSIGFLTALRRLSVGRNQLTSLPSSIENLRALDFLDVSRNETMTSVPNEVLNLPSASSVDLTGCGLSQTVLDSLQAAVARPEYFGPRIYHSILEPRHVRPMGVPVVELLADLARITGRDLELSPVYDLPGQETLLQIWLSRLSDIADYKAGVETKRALASSVQNYVKMASENPAFREVFYNVLEGATQTCGDRVALSFLQLGLAHDLGQIDAKDKVRLAKFLIRGLFVMGLLEDIARSKVASLRFVDEIEVYLGYPVMLKERLELPINTENMLYARCSNITPQDLDCAEGFIRERLSNEESLCRFLVKQDKWKESLRESYPAEVRRLEDQRETSAERASEVAEYEKIHKRFDEGLVELTKRDLNFREFRLL